MANGISVIEKIKNALDNLVKLKIVTAVGDVVVKEGSKTFDFDLKNAKASVTIIDLLQGDITTIYHEEFVTGKYTELKNFHSEREKEGYARVKANIEALGELLKLAKSFIT